MLCAQEDQGEGDGQVAALPAPPETRAGRQPNLEFSNRGDLQGFGKGQRRDWACLQSIFLFLYGSVLLASKFGLRPKRNEGQLAG